MSLQIKNTVVSNSSLGDLDASELQSLLLSVAYQKPAVITMVASTDHNLTLEEWQVALTHPSGLGVNTTAMTGGEELNIFSDAVDTAAYARQVIATFGLSSAANPITACFRVASVVVTEDVKLAGPSTHVYVNTLLNGGSEAASNVMLTATNVVGDKALVEIYASNFTSGSEVVNFNILNG